MPRLQREKERIDAPPAAQRANLNQYLCIATRAIGEQLSVRWGQQVLIEAGPGAGGLIAGQAVASALPDGYTLLGGPASLFTILPAQKDKLPIDVSKSFVQLGMVVSSGVMFIAVTPKLGISTFPEFVALARSKPGQIAIGTNGAGTLPHFAGDDSRLSYTDRDARVTARPQGVCLPRWNCDQEIIVESRPWPRSFDHLSLAISP